MGEILSKEELDLKVKESNFKALLERGLNQKEAEQFMGLLEKITPTNSDIEGFYEEMEQSIPFEGGMGFVEALTGLKETQ
jgi:hypothetical protein